MYFQTRLYWKRDTQGKTHTPLFPKCPPEGGATPPLLLHKPSPIGHKVQPPPPLMENRPRGSIARLVGGRDFKSDQLWVKRGCITPLLR